MPSVMSRTEEKEERDRRRRLHYPFGVTADVVACTLAIAAVIAICVLLYQRYNLRGPYRMEYEGLIVNKSVTIEESLTGSYPVLRLHVKGRDGRVFEVIVNASLYDRAESGMWIKSTADGAAVSRPTAEAAPGK
jgi:uncharacterized Fe-S cluster-containing radical SAM superfamily protein